MPRDDVQFPPASVLWACGLVGEPGSCLFVPSPHWYGARERAAVELGVPPGDVVCALLPRLPEDP